MGTFGLLSIIMLIVLIIAGSLFCLLLPFLALIDIFRSKFEGNNQLLMVLIVLLVPLGAIIYFIAAPSLKIKDIA
ncbi:MAG: PLDc N-terminal domain-containing protein [Paludibacteraceae bacterium]